MSPIIGKRGGHHGGMPQSGSDLEDEGSGSSLGYGGTNLKPTEFNNFNDDGLFEDEIIRCF
jgi:hypothetical protein